MYSVQASMFEGLFVRALRVEPSSDFARALAEAGYALQAPRAVYEVEVWTACLDVAAARLHPELARFEAWRRLGRVFIDGYFQTPIGRVIAVALPLMKVDRFVERVPQFLRTGLGGSTCEVDQPEPGEATLHLHGPHGGAAWVLSGVLEVCFARLGTTGTFTPEALDEVESRLAVRWAP